MHLRRLTIDNFRRIAAADILLEPATFLIGPNNTGKRSVIAAIEALLSLESEKLTQTDILVLPDGTRAESAVITGYICDIPADVAASRGFKGRVINGEFVYKKTLSTSSSKPTLETREYPFTVKPEFSACKTIGDLRTAGLTEEAAKDGLGSTDKLKKGWERGVPDVLDFDTTAEPSWVQNPGGIPQNVLSRLPRLIHIPAMADNKDIESGEKRHILGECLSLLFEDLVQDNPVAKTIQKNLDVLEAEMNPEAEGSLVFGLLRDVNGIIGDVFPNCGISIMPSLQNLLDVLKPKYEISVFSNIKTDVVRQGTGLVRTCIFAMLRHHARMKIEKALQTRPVIVAFEEPELYLHPSAANMLRDTIYELGQSDQIVCSTHSPWMIDLARDPQSLSRMYLGADGTASAYNYGVSSILGALPEDDKRRVKMLQIFDDELSRVFFAENVVIVEGDSQVVAVRETLKLLPQDVQKEVQSKYQLVKARGKASIISLVKYLKELGMNPRVMHDGDFGVEGAEKFNKPISDALSAPDHLVVLDKNLEEALGYVAPTRDKPFKAYECVRTWAAAADVPKPWREAITGLFGVEWPE
ncbi:MAG: AAA family ATPase [Planctomycetes bacterium]|nr:AAA family ATPase [Planctomycetota bacterium]